MRSLNLSFTSTSPTNASVEDHLLVTNVGFRLLKSAITSETDPCFINFLNFRISAGTSMALLIRALMAGLAMVGTERDHWILGSLFPPEISG